MPGTRPKAASGSGTLSGRGFWAIFAGAWLAYLALYVTAASGAKGVPLGWALALAIVETLPPAALSVVVAVYRHELLQPEWSVGRTALVHALVGLVYAAGTAALSAVAMKAVTWPPSIWPEGSEAEPFALRVVAAFLLYAILAGFLMWTESLRRLHESRSLAAREAMLRAQAEARALRAQFNPHFVFNTLHSLMLLVRLDPLAAERAIEDVATLIRYASVLQRHDVDLVPLAKELEVAQRYVALERLRLSDRLSVGWSVDVEPTSVAVPPFALQTLVENAIKHGIEPKPEGGRLDIRAALDGEALSLTASDDGCGADPESVAAASNHGLDILKRRIASLYGAGASLTWRTSPGAGFSTTLRIPAQAPPPLPVPVAAAAHARP